MLYQKPNPDGSRKSCNNCVTWVRTNRCLVHDPDLEVKKNMICGYYIYGTPQERWPESWEHEPVDKELSGLDTVDGGTSCDVCKWYDGDDDEGLCQAVNELGTTSPAPVQARGCCARWEASES